MKRLIAGGLLAALEDYFEGREKGKGETHLFACPVCGAKLDPEVAKGNFCPYCGANINGEPQKFINGEPQKLNEFIDQIKAKIKCEMAMTLAYDQQPIPTLPHVLITGNAGTGKTTLAKILANEMKTKILAVTANNLCEPYDFTKLIVKAWEVPIKITPNTVAPIIFIDEIHALKAKIQESLYAPLAEGMIETPRGRHEAPPFSLIAATTQGGRLSIPLLTRFQITITLEPYNIADIALILEKRAQAWGMEITHEKAWEIAKRSRLTPRIAINHMRMASTLGFDLEKYFAIEEIDEEGLGVQDRRILTALYNAKRPCSLEAIATMTNINQTEIEAFWEPYLVQKQLIALTAQGRAITDQGIKYLKSILQPRKP